MEKQSNLRFEFYLSSQYSNTATCRAFVLFPRHCFLTFGTFFLKARMSLLVRYTFTALRTNAVPARTPAGPAALSRASSRAGALACGTCFVSLWHCNLLR